jgi:hypothetical protein
MRVTADGERRRDTQVGVFVKAPAVTVLDARPGGLGADNERWEPQGWRAHGRKASGRGFEQSSGVHFWLEEEYSDPTVAVVLLNQTKRW